MGDKGILNNDLVVRKNELVKCSCAIKKTEMVLAYL